MTKRRMPRIAQYAVLILYMAGRARAQPGDPNMPNPSGGFITLAPNPQGQEMLAYAWTQGTDVPPVISVSELKGTVKRPMSYLGYNGEGTWMTTDGSVYVLKGDSLRKTNLRLDQLPGNLRNGSAAYFTYTGIDPDKARTASGGAQPSNPEPPRGDGRAGASRDPNLPNPSGGFIDLAPNPQGKNMLAYTWDGSDAPPEIYVSEMRGTRKVSMIYLGYNGEGTWMTAESSVYVFKGDNLLKTNLRIGQLPRDLRNGSPEYFAWTGIDPQRTQAASGGAQPSNPDTPRGDGRAGASTDPNLPNPSGGFITLAANPQGQEVVAYAWQGSDVPPQVFVSSMKGTRKVAMSYFGYNGEGTWIMGEGSVYVLKGNILRKTNLQVRQLPKNLRNGSPAYFSYTGVDPDKPKQDAGQTPSSSSPAGSRRPPHAPSALEQAAAPAGGHDARILREASGVTLVYADADGEHRYRVQRPAMGLPGAAAQQLNATDTGGWIYVAPDGASGILFNVTADHAVTATKLPAQALGMLVRR